MARNFSVNIDTTSTLPPGPEWISVPAGKALTAVIMFVTVIAAIFSPIIAFGQLNINRQRISFRDKLQLWIGRLSCFAAGVFLSTGFMDIFPDVIRALSEAGAKLHIKMTFPLASFFTLIGFFLILSIEQLILIYKNHLSKLNAIPSKAKRKVSEVVDEESREAFLSSITGSNDTMLYDDNRNKVMSINRSTSSILMDQEHAHHHTGPEAEDEYDEHADIFHHNKSRIFALMSAMSVHAVFEGLAIGLGTTVAGVTQLFIALSMHKLIIAASLGLNLATAQLALWVKVMVSLIFASASPIGIGLGILIMSQEQGHNGLYMVAGVLEGVACGTFLYVVFFEILPHELGHDVHEDRGGKLTCVILGFIFVSLYLMVMTLI